MKTILLLLSAFACLPAHANVPKKAPLVKYSGLWANSPFTSKPVVESVGPAVNPFEDFTLAGISPVPGGHRITIISKKNPDVRKVIEPGGNSEFKVVSVNRNPQESLGTTVVLSSGSVQGTVSFEPDLITLKAAPAAPQANPNLPPGVIPNQPPQAGQNAGDTPSPRIPRPRIVPPNNPSGTAPAPNANPQQPQPQTQGQGGTKGDSGRREFRRR